MKMMEANILNPPQPFESLYNRGIKIKNKIKGISECAGKKMQL